ncbi:MAG: serine/threonine-protein phosphatase [Prevotella sp.]|nr:serine/threonine-protein phosphatase [Prevotella sp.]
MKYKLKVYSIWECGQRTDSQGNPHQEDSIYPEHGKHSELDRLFILCDGMGGHDAGEVASATVCKAMSQSILANVHDKDGFFSSEDFTKALNDAFEALDTRDSGAEKKMGTTMTFLKLHNEGAFLAHLGDSRIYHIRPGKNGESTEILKQTDDHSLINDLIKVGELRKEEARLSKQKNILTRAMQPHMDRRPKADIYTTTDIKPGDYFYMCSDGMLEQPDMEEGTSLKNIFSELGGDDENKVEMLKSVTENNKDNHTAIIIHITDVIDPIVKNERESSYSLNSNKFTAIVEDDSDELKVPLDNNIILVAQQNNKTEGIKSDRRKSTLIMIIRFVLAAVVVLTIIIGFKSIKSCSSSNNKPVEELFDKKNNIKRNERSHSQKPNGNKKNYRKENTTENPEVQTTNPPSPNNSNSSQNNVEPSTSSQPTITMPSNLKPGDDVVSSDAQVVQDNIKK